MQIKCHNPRYIKAALKPDQYPQSHLPEVAVVGRSNVGKSTLINDLFRHKNLAKTSSTPGKTRYLQFFSIDDQLLFCDLPGYGYAKQQDDTWDEMISTYLTQRENLKLLLLLLDCRHEPSALDLQMIDWVQEMHFRVIVILTKCDKLKKGELEEQTKKILKPFGEECPPFVHYSATHGEGRRKLLLLIGNAL